MENNQNRNQTTPANQQKPKSGEYDRDQVRKNQQSDDKSGNRSSSTNTNR